MMDKRKQSKNKVAERNGLYNTFPLILERMLRTEIRFMSRIVAMVSSS